MKKILMTKSQKKKEKILSLIAELSSYKHSISLLDGYASGKLKLNGKSFSEYAASYKRTKEDDERYRWTKKHIQLQISILERELAILAEYGA